MNELNFACLEDSSNGVLSPDDLHFFYYDIGIDNESCMPVLYEENEEVKRYIDSKHLTIEIVERSNLPTDFQDGVIMFTTNGCDKSKIDALFRHLRNAFSHYHIKRQGEYFLMNDYYYDKKGNGMSMIGKIKCKDLFDYCYLLFKQRESYIDNV